MFLATVAILLAIHFIQTSSSLVANLVYSPGCTHCVDFKPVWEKVSQNVSHCQFQAIDATRHPDNHLVQMVRGYPTIVITKQGNPHPIDIRPGAMTESQLRDFLNRFK